MANLRVNFCNERASLKKPSVVSRWYKIVGPSICKATSMPSPAKQPTRDLSFNYMYMPYVY